MIDENAARVILKKLKIADYDPQEFTAQINRACNSYRLAKSNKKPLRGSKIKPKLTSVAGTAKKLSHQITKLNTSGVITLLSPWITVQDRSLMEFFTDFQRKLDGLQKLVHFAESRILKELKDRSKPIKISIARQNFFGQLLSIFDQIISRGGALQGFLPPISNDGVFLHDDGVAFAVEVVRQFPLIRDEILAAAVRRKKSPTPLRSETDQLYQAVAWNIARLIRGLNARQEARRST